MTNLDQIHTNRMVTFIMKILIWKMEANGPLKDHLQTKGKEHRLKKKMR